MRNTILAKPTLVCCAISFALFNSTSAFAFTDETKVLRSISLIKKPGKPTAIDNVSMMEQRQLRKKLMTSLFNNEITRELNKYPGVHAVNTIVNDNSPNVAYDSIPSKHSASMLSEHRNLAPLPYLAPALTGFGALNMTQIFDVSSPQLNRGAMGLVGGIATQTNSIAQNSGINLSYGSDNDAEIGIDYGHTSGKWGHLFQANYQQVDSYRQAQSSLDGDAVKMDVLLKIQEQGSSIGSTNQQLTSFTVRHQKFDNNESRMGISDNDLELHSTRRYSATANDFEKTQRVGFDLEHQVTLASKKVIETSFYYDSGQVNLYQTEWVDGQSGKAAVDLLSEFEINPQGELSVTKQALNRDFSSGGVKVAIKQQIGAHQLEWGGNYHREASDDTFYRDVYQLSNSFDLTLQSGDNAVSQYKNNLDATSVYVKDHWVNGALAIDFTLKYEDLNREIDDGTSMSQTSSKNTIGNLGFTYHLSNAWQLFISGHQGVLPSVNWMSSELSQTSLVTRTGVIYEEGVSEFSLIGFNNQFFNMYSRCVSLSTCKNLTDDRNDAQIRGVHLTAKHQFATDTMAFPIAFSYTFRDHEYTSELDAANIAESISVGDELAFLPKHQAFMQFGMNTQNWELAARVTYRAKQRKMAGIDVLNTQNSIAATTLVDMSASYQIDNKQNIYATINNVLDKKYVESAFNGSNLIGRGRNIQIGYRYRF